MSATKILRRALLSVSDKTGIVTLAQALAAQGVEILSTGGTAAALVEAKIPVTEVSAHTGFPEIMGGRVKTLHPKIHGGILGRRGVDDALMSEHDIAPIDLVVVNLYPFQATVARADCSFDEAIENIDIGGPTALRAAAKNHADVAVVTDPDDYAMLIEALSTGLSAAQRLTLATKTFAHTAQYDAQIAQYLQKLDNDPLPQSLTLPLERVDVLRYGENPHQAAAFYRDPSAAAGSLAQARLLQGKPLSFNNLADADAALDCVRAFDAPSVVIVKHANPCGVATASDLLSAYQRAYATDPTSAFGGIIACNRPLDASTAAAIIQQFVEVIIAPGIAEDAQAILAAKPNVRVLDIGTERPCTHALTYQRIGGGLLVQQSDEGLVDAEALRQVSRRAPSEQELADLHFAWKVAKFVKSNAIVYAHKLATIGVGAGQMSRVYSARIAGIKAQDAGLQVAGAVMASDAFFPFRDGIDAAAKAGIRAVIQPGGSMRDEEIIQAADEHDIAMLFTGMRHFRH